MVVGNISLHSITKRRIAMSRRTFHSTEEWMQLVTTCRQSGLSDKDWCAANGINISTFYNAVARLRQKACQIPERETNTDTIHDLTVKALPDVVPVSIIPETKTGPPAAPALLIIDEWLLYPLSDADCANLLELIHKRRKHASNIFCSQYRLEGWCEKLGGTNQTLTEASMDRIAYDSYKIMIESSDPEKDISMREVYGLDPALAQ